ncbi:MAG: hypothetical protein GX330_07610 [Bacteroidales bacterium]|nr:hypothetical protein [Bacteroidales bacterium]
MKRNIIRIAFLFSLLIMLFSCNNKTERLHKKIEKTITEYLSKDLNHEDRIDSIQILQVDSLSDYHFTKLIIDQAINNRIDELSFLCSYLTNTEDIEELELRGKYESEINMLIDRSMHYEKQLRTTDLDSSNFKYFFVTTIVFTSKDNVSNQEYYGFPITTDFEIREINEVIF